MGKRINGFVVDAEMVRNVQQYIDYVRSFTTKDSIQFYETRVEFTDYVPEGFGTCDAMVYRDEDKHLHIFDLKYGKGVEVSAVNNTQGQIYALGGFQEFGDLLNFEQITIHIVQPRIGNYSEWHRTLDELNNFGEYVRERAILALSDDPPRTAGEKQCRWCAAQATCKATYEWSYKQIEDVFDDLTEPDPNLLTEEQLRDIYDRKDELIRFTKAVETYIFNQTLEGEFKGFKIVEGRANRKWKPEAIEELEVMLGEEAFTKKPITLTEAKKRLSAEDIDRLTVKPDGKPTLVKDTDKRKAMALDDHKGDFDYL